MKRHFMKSLKAFGMGVMALVAASSLVVSCYDDTALRGEISGVKEDIKDLGARLDSLESKLSEQISAVQALYAAVEELQGADETLGGEIDAAAAAIKVAEVETLDNGKVSIVLTDGTSFEIEPASKNANPIVTVIDNTWALVDPATGTASPIKVNDATVPVAHPGFNIRFNETTRVVEVTVDGGATWTASNVVIPAEQEMPEIPECGALIEDIYEDGRGNIVFSTTWGEEIVLPLAQEFSFNVKSGKLSFDYGDIKEVPVEVNNVEDFAVMTKPEGWKASFNDKLLVITAPTEEAVTAGADKEGFVRVHVTTTDGKCKVAKLAVSVLPGLTVSVDLSGNIVVTNPFVSEIMNEITGETMMCFDEYYLGITTDIETFEADPAAFIQSLDYNFDVIGGYPYNVFPENKMSYDALTNPVDIIETTVAEYAEMVYADAPERGQPAIVFVVSFDQRTYAYDAENMAFAYYEPKEATVIVDETTITWNEAEIEAHMYGYNSYEYGVAMSEDQLYSGFMNWQNYFQYGVSMGGMISSESGSYAGPLSKFGLEEGAESSPLLPGTTYYAYVLGITEGMDPKSITWDDFRANNVWTITTDSLVSGGSSTSSATFTATYTNVTATLTASDDAVMVWHGFFDVEDIPAESTNDELVAILLEDGYIAADFPATVKSTTVGSGTAFKYMSVAVNADGQYGTVNIQDASTNVFEYSDTFTLNVSDADVYLNGSSAAVYIKFSGEGGTLKSLRYYNVKASNTTYTDEHMAKEMPVKSSYPYTNVQVSTLPGGILKLNNVSKGDYRFGVIGYDENGEVAEYQSISYTVGDSKDYTGIFSYKTDADYATSKPTCELTLVTASKNWSKYSCKVNVPEGCMAWVGMGKPADAEEKYTDATALANAIIGGGLQSKYYVGELSQEFNYVYPTYNFYMTWIDANGKYHETEIIPLPSAE